MSDVNCRKYRASIRWRVGAFYFGLMIVLIMSVSGQTTPQTTFTDVTKEAGLQASLDAVGAAWGDFDNDGYIDLFVCHHLQISEAQLSVLYRNQGDGTFIQVLQLGKIVGGLLSRDRLNGKHDDHGVAWGDYDNDGDLDLFISRGNGQVDSLYRNDGGGIFIDVGTESGVEDLGGRGRTVSWVDIDNDGNLDIFVTNNQTPHRLFVNNGNGTFTEMADAAGLKVPLNQGKGAAWADYNLDGFMDLFVTMTIDPREPSSNPPMDFLFRNNGDRTFTDVTRQVGIQRDGGSRGVAWGDFDNDGDLDLFIVKENSANILYENDGNGSFSNISVSAGVSSQRSGNQAIWGDYDNDGDLDLYVVTLSGNNLLYRNNGNKTFTDVADAAGVIAKGSPFQSGAIWGDHNNDGFLDLFLSDERTAGGRNPHLLLRNNGNHNHWLKIRLVGTISNRDGTGAKLWLRAGDKLQFREQNGGSHLLSQNSMMVHFGLGQSTKIDTLTIQWPSGIIQEIGNVLANQTILITEPNQ